MRHPPPLPIPVTTSGGDRWGQQPANNVFTFDNVGSVNRLPSSDTTQSPASYNQSPYHQTPMGGDRSTWTSPSPRRDEAPAQASTQSQPLPSGRKHQPAGHHRYNEADDLEQEYKRLTGKKGSHRESALKNVKKLQEERRIKLEALTARVVENRRRFAQIAAKASEAKNSDDRPREIAFVDSRDDHHQHHTRGEQKKPKSTKKELKNLDHALDKILEEKKVIVKATRVRSEQSSNVSGDQSSSVLARGIFSDEDYSNGPETSTGEDETRDFLGMVTERKSNDPASASRVRTGTKAKDSANNFVEKLREKRTQAKGNGTDYDIEPTYSRQDVLSALETGTTQISLPTRDPKLARKNRKQLAQRLVGGQMPSKIAMKRSTCSTDANIKQTRSAVRDSELVSDSEHLSNHGLAVIKKYAIEESKPDHEGEPQRRNLEETQNRRTTSSTIMSDLSESAYGGFTAGGGNVHEREEEEEEDGSNIHGFGIALEEPSDTTPSDTTSMFEDDANYLISGTARTAEEDDDITMNTPVSQKLTAKSSKIKKTGREKKAKLKVRSLTANSIAEGFEIEEGYDLLSIVSGRSQYSGKAPRGGDQEESFESPDETAKRLDTLKLLERNLNPKEFQDLVPDLLEFTDAHGWDARNVMKHFMHALPHLIQGTHPNGFLKEAAHQHDSFSASTVHARTTTASTAGPSNRATELEDRKQPPQDAQLRQTPSQAKPPRNDLPVSPKSPRGAGSTEPRETPPQLPQPSTGSSDGTGWRSRVRAGSLLRSSTPDPSSIDMSDVRTSLKSLSRNRRSRKAAGSSAGSQILEES